MIDKLIVDVSDAGDIIEKVKALKDEINRLEGELDVANQLNHDLDYCAEAALSELGIAFDDLKREKDALEERLLVLIDSWRETAGKRSGYYDFQDGESFGMQSCAGELEEILNAEAGKNQAEEV